MSNKELNKICNEYNIKSPVERLYIAGVISTFNEKKIDGLIFTEEINKIINDFLNIFPNLDFKEAFFYALGYIIRDLGVITCKIGFNMDENDIKECACDTIEDIFIDDEKSLFDIAK